jgi:hypothetical protein
MSSGAPWVLGVASRLRSCFAIACLVLNMMLAAPVLAASNNTSQVNGTAAAAVVVPSTMTNLGDMRFGNLVQPSTAGTLTLSPTGAVTTSGGVSGNQAIAQGSTGPSPGTFSITAGSNQVFTVFGPITFSISSGASTMPVTLLTGALQKQSNNGTTANYLLSVGGTLSVGANQAIGTYVGSYTLLTVYQ